MDHRLKKNKQFSFLYKKGKRSFTKHLILYSISSKYRDYRIGFSVSKKIGKANVRNKVKRRMKEIVRTNNFAQNYNSYVLVAKEGIADLSFQDLTNEIKEIFLKC